jgi:hypothetical protein
MSAHKRTLMGTMRKTTISVCVHQSSEGVSLLMAGIQSCMIFQHCIRFVAETALMGMGRMHTSGNSLHTLGA